MIRIPGGSFWMGSEGRFTWESPRHRVFIDAFDIAPTSVTRREYEMFLRDTSHEEPKGWQDTAFANPDQPVVGVNWFDAVAYCEWLTKMKTANLPAADGSGMGKSLPRRKRRWEYAWGNEPPESIEYFQGEWTGPRPVGHMASRMISACSTWETMFTNGAWTGSPRIIMRCRRKKIRRPARMERGAFREAVRGGIRSRDRAPHIAAVCRRSFDIRIMGFAWCEEWETLK